MTEHVSMSMHVCVSVLIHVHVNTLVRDRAQLRSKRGHLLYMSAIAHGCARLHHVSMIMHAHVSVIMRGRARSRVIVQDCAHKHCVSAIIYSYAQSQ